LSNRKPGGAAPDGPSHTGDAEGATRRTTSRELFGEARLVLIEHEGETYALRLTRLGKLILTK